MTHFAHDWIVHIGGAEAVLADLIRQYGSPTSKIFVLHSTTDTFVVDASKYQVITALPWWINNLFDERHPARRFAFYRWIFDYRNLMPIYPLLCWLLRSKILASYIHHTDAKKLVISSFAAVKNVVPKNGWNDIDTTLYLHSPMQYIRENYEEYCKKLTGVKGWMFVQVTRYLRPRDQQMRHYDSIIANSTYTARCASRIYGLTQRNISVQYPNVHPDIYTLATVQKPKDYFIYVGRLVNFVRELDKIIQLANTLSIPLLVLGDGPDAEMLKASAGPTITFLGHISDIKTKIELITYARGYINLAQESAGLGTMEALLCGVPVFGYRGGGTKELVDDASGFLITDKSEMSLIEGFESFMMQDFDKAYIQERARKMFI